jgi:hypothetical protein
MGWLGRAVWPVVIWLEEATAPGAIATYHPAQPSIACVPSDGSRRLHGIPALEACRCRYVPHPLDRRRWRRALRRYHNQVSAAHRDADRALKVDNHECRLLRGVPMASTSCSSRWTLSLSGRLGRLAHRASGWLGIDVDDCDRCPRVSVAQMTAEGHGLIKASCTRVLLSGKRPTLPVCRATSAGQRPGRHPGSHNQPASAPSKSDTSSCSFARLHRLRWRGPNSPDSQTGR